MNVVWKKNRNRKRKKSKEKEKTKQNGMRVFHFFLSATILIEIRFTEDRLSTLQFAEAEKSRRQRYDRRHHGHSTRRWRGDDDDEEHQG